MNTDRVTLIAVAAAILALPLSLSPVCAAGAKEVSKDIIAVQIRKQGFECRNPESAQHDMEASKPDAEVWVLKCQGVSYRVQLIPNMAAKVEKLPEEASHEGQNGEKP